jgi:hypothetical protein
MSDDEWDKCLVAFRRVTDSDASDEHSIQLAWDTLRQGYRNKFNAKVSAHSTQQNEEPFGIWAADNLSEHAIERVLCLIFRKELAECNHITLLRSTAAKANKTVWYMLLLFGASLFSESLLCKVRKRLRVFNIDPVTGTSNFKTAYMRVLRAQAKRTKVALDTTSIAVLNAVRVFISPDLTAMASANPEFDLPSRRTGDASGSLQKQGQGASHSTADAVRTVSKQEDSEAQKTKKPEGNARAQGRENGVLSQDLAPAGGETVKPSIEFNVPDRQPDHAGKPATGPRLHRSESEGEQSFLPSATSMASSDTHSSSSTRRNPPRKGRPGQIYFGPELAEIGAVPTDENENIFDPEAISGSAFSLRPNRSTYEEPETRVGSTIYCAPVTVKTTSKRPLQAQEKGRAATPKDGSKRPNNTPTRSALLENGSDWDDNTILAILEQLEATGHPDYVVVDGMSDGDVSTRKQLSGAAGWRGSLLVPLKLEAGQRLLVVVELKPRGKLGTGVLRYYDPCGPPDEDTSNGYAPAVKLTPLLSHVLPGRDLGPKNWETQHCVCPELSCEQDSGISICLGAVYAVGERPLPEVVDWTFWRHLLLGAFFPDDAAVRLRIGHYRDEILNKLVRQGQMSHGVSVPRGRRVSSDIEYLGTAAMNPVDRIECRADNARKIIEVAHESCRIFNNLQEKVDKGTADIKTRLDKSIHIRDSLRRKLNIGDQIVLGEPLPKVEPDDETAEGFDRLTLQQAIEDHGLCKALLGRLSASNESVGQALHHVATWRRDVTAAVMEDDASLSDKGAGRSKAEV